SESVEWYTPARYLEAVREVLGEIDLDPASNAVANKWVQAKTFYTAADDGLSRDWHGRVFMNPPYGKTSDGDSVAEMFCAKALAEYDTGTIESAIILVNSLHSQAWQAQLYDQPTLPRRPPNSIHFRRRRRKQEPHDAEHVRVPRTRAREVCGR